MKNKFPFSPAGSFQSGSRQGVDIFHFPFSLRDGFTLVELLVVIALLSILITGLITLIDPAALIKKSNDTRRKSDLRQIQNALEAYRADISSYPASVTCNGAILSGTNIYMSKVPCDPKGTSVSYNYAVVGNGYRLYACLENPNDKDKDTTPQTGCTTSFTVINP